MAQNLGLAMKDLKIAVTSSFADDLTAAATKLTEWVIQASDLWDQINPRRPDTRSQAERAPGPPPTGPICSSLAAAIPDLRTRQRDALGPDQLADR